MNLVNTFHKPVLHLLQTLVFNYLASGIPTPPHLIAHLRRSFYFLDQYPSMSIGRRAEEDPEPWRCKRTDGKKRRCSKEAFQDSNYCERHMHRGKKSSRKLVELPAVSSNSHLFLGSPSYIMAAEDHRSHRSECYSFFSEERESSRQQQHCYVLGTHLMSQKPAVRWRESPNSAMLVQ